MYCAKCGAYIPDGATVCPTCGITVSPETAIPSAEPDPVSPTVPLTDAYAAGSADQPQAAYYEQPAGNPEAAYQQPAQPPAFQQVTYIPDKAILSPEQSVYGLRYSYGYNQYLYDRNRAALAQSGYSSYAQPQYTYGQNATGSDLNAFDYAQEQYSYDWQNAAESAAAGSAEETPAADVAEAAADAAETAGLTDAAAYDAAFDEYGQTGYCGTGDSYGADDYYGSGDYYGASDYYGTDDYYGSGYYNGTGDYYDAGSYYDNYGYDPNASYIGADPIYLQSARQKGPKKIGMKWFKFLIYFHFFFFAVISFIYGIFLLVDGFPKVINAGLNYAKAMPAFAQDGQLLDGLGEIFGEIFASMRVFGIILAVLTILMAVFGIIVRGQLAKYRRVGPKMLNLFFVARMVFKIAANGLAVLLFAKNFVAYLDTFPYMTYLYIVPFAIMIPSALFTLLVLLLSKKYFKKRKDMFNKPELPEEQQTAAPDPAAAQDQAPLQEPYAAQEPYPIPDAAYPVQEDAPVE